MVVIGKHNTFSLNRLPGPIQSLSFDVRQLCVCLCVPSRKTRFPVDWRLLDKDHIANIDMSLTQFWGFGVFANQPTVLWKS